MFRTRKRMEKHSVESSSAGSVAPAYAQSTLRDGDISPDNRISQTPHDIETEPCHQLRAFGAATDMEQPHLPLCPSAKARCGAEPISADHDFGLVGSIRHIERRHRSGNYACFLHISNIIFFVLLQRQTEQTIHEKIISSLPMSQRLGASPLHHSPSSSPMTCGSC